jgi:streptogramin lyase
MSSGKLDATYGAGGSVVLQNGQDSSEMAVGRDGTVIVTGKTVARLDPSGVSMTFGDPLPSERSVYSPVLDPAGDLYAKIFDSTTGASSLAKFDSQGRLAPDFGNAGVTSLGVFAGKLLRDPAGQLYLATTFPSGGIETMWVAKYDSAGRQVTSYGNGGFGKVPVEGQRAFIQGAAVDADGNVYVLGALAPLVVPGAPGMAVAKLDSNGRLADFATGGVWTRGCGDAMTPTAIAVDAGRNVFVGASCFHLASGASEIMLFKLDPRGSVVTSFRDGGMRANPLGTNALIRAIVVAPGGAIYVAGEVGDRECADLVVAKLDAQGNEVAAFGNNGIATLDNADDELTNLALDDAGRLYLGSTLSTCGPSLPGVNAKGRIGYAVYRIGG